MYNGEFQVDLEAYFRIIRPSICFFEAIIAIIGQILAKGVFPESTIALKAFISIFLITASGNVLNDYLDYEVDSVNTPWRPIPSGKVSRASALQYGILLGILGIAVTLLVNLAAATLGLVIFMLTNLYSVKGKIYGIVGNTIIAFTISSCFLFGVLTVTTNIKPYNVFIFGLCFLYVLGGEVIQSIADAEGDKVRGVKSIAIVCGHRTAAVVASICYALMAIGGTYTAFQFSLGIDFTYTIIIIVFTVLIIGVITVPLLRRPDKETARRTRSIVNVIAFLLILGFIVILLI